MSLVEITQKGSPSRHQRRFSRRDPFESISSYRRSCYFYKVSMDQTGRALDFVRLRTCKRNGHRVFLFHAIWSGKSGENTDNQDTSVIKRTTGKKKSLAFERLLWVWRNCLGCLCKRDDLHVHHLTAHERKRWMGWKKTQKSEKFMENEVRFPKPRKSKFGPWISSVLRNFQRIHSAPSKYHFTTNYSTRV